MCMSQKLFGSAQDFSVTSRALTMACCCAAVGDEDELKISPAVPAVDDAAVGPAAAPKAPEFGVFTIVVPTSDHSTLGLAFDSINPVGTGRMITEVKEGAVRKFNTVEPDQSIQPLDILVSIDGVEDVKEMDAKLASKLPALVSLKLNRPKKVQVSFCKTGGLGLKMDWKDKSMGAIVSEIHATGLIATWNAEHSSQSVSVGDRFVEFNGKTCAGKEFLQLLKDDKGEKEINLTLLKYWDHWSLREPCIFCQWGHEFVRRPLQSSVVDTCFFSALAGLRNMFDRPQPTHWRVPRDVPFCFFLT